MLISLEIKNNDLDILSPDWYQEKSFRQCCHTVPILYLLVAQTLDETKPERVKLKGCSRGA